MGTKTFIASKKHVISHTNKYLERLYNTFKKIAYSEVFYEIVDFFMLNMCSRLIFCSKMAQKSKTCSCLLEPQKVAPNAKCC